MDEPRMLPFEPGRPPFVRGWGLAGVLVIPLGAWSALGAVTVSGLDPTGVAASLVTAGVLVVVALGAFLGLRALQRRDRERLVERYAQERLPSLQRIAAGDAYGRGGFTDLEDAWRSVEREAMAFFDRELAVVREVHRDPHRLCWLPVQYVAALPAAMALHALFSAVATAVG